MLPYAARYKPSPPPSTPNISGGVARSPPRIRSRAPSPHTPEALAPARRTPSADSKLVQSMGSVSLGQSSLSGPQRTSSRSPDHGLQPTRSRRDFGTQTDSHDTIGISAAGAVYPTENQPWHPSRSRSGLAPESPQCQRGGHQAPQTGPDPERGRGLGRGGLQNSQSPSKISQPITPKNPRGH